MVKPGPKVLRVFEVDAQTSEPASSQFGGLALAIFRGVSAGTKTQGPVFVILKVRLCTSPASSWSKRLQQLKQFHNQNHKHPARPETARGGIDFHLIPV